MKNCFYEMVAIVTAVVASVGVSVVMAAREVVVVAVAVPVEAAQVVAAMAVAAAGRWQRQESFSLHWYQG